MKKSVEEDLAQLDTIPCLKIEFKNSYSHMDMFRFYRLHNVRKWRYFENSRFAFLRKLGKHLPERTSFIPTCFVFSYGMYGSSNWLSITFLDKKYLCLCPNHPEISLKFEDVFDAVSQETKEQLIYHLDIFGS